MADLDALKEIPGYKAILKSVLKSQIQLLLEQLSDQTGEESIILTASVHDGTLSHLGSWTGKGFLDGREEIKSQFLGYCLKSHHRASTQESRSSPYERPQPFPRKPMIKRPRTSSYGEPHGEITQTPSPSGYNLDNSVNSGNSSTAYQSDFHGIGAELKSDHMQPSASKEYKLNESHIPNTDRNSSETFPEFNASNIKVEALEDNEDLEITGIEAGHAMQGSTDSWAQGMGTSTCQGTEMDASGDMTNYNRQEDTFGAEIKSFDYHMDQYGNTTNTINDDLRPEQKDVKFQCEVCNKVLKNNQCLRKHLMIHYGVKPFACTFCDKRFRQKHHLQCHILVSHQTESADTVV